jgi:hypothetical protein
MNLTPVNRPQSEFEPIPAPSVMPLYHLNHQGYTILVIMDTQLNKA